MGGNTEFNVSTIDSINRLISEGKLPESHFCVISGLPTDEIHRFYVECERTWRTGLTDAGKATSVLAALLIPLDGFTYC